MNKKEFLAGFSKRLKLECFLSGKKYHEIASLAGFSATSLYHYMQARGVPNSVNLANLCEVLDVSADWLIFGDSDGN